MIVKELLPLQPTVCMVDDYLQKVVNLMTEKDLSCIPVVESLAHMNPIGVVSEKDICRQTIAAGLNPAKLTVGRVMNCHFLTVSPETEIEDCYRLMRENKAKYLLVCDANNVCRGVITENQVAQKKLLITPPQVFTQSYRVDRIF